MIMPILNKIDLRPKYKNKVIFINSLDKNNSS